MCGCDSVLGNDELNSCTDGILACVDCEAKTGYGKSMYYMPHLGNGGQGEGGSRCNVVGQFWEGFFGVQSMYRGSVNAQDGMSKRTWMVAGIGEAASQKKNPRGVCVIWALFTGRVVFELKIQTGQGGMS